MSEKSKRYVIGVDPSGNFKEGKGITGLAIYDRKEDKIVWVGDVKAVDYQTRPDYHWAVWDKVKELYNEWKDAVLSVEDYVLYATKAKEQINSNLETPKLIGILEMMALKNSIPYYTRTASRAKPRWTEDILVAKGYIERSGRGYKWRGQNLMTHHRDAMKHAIQCGKFEVKE